MTGRYLNIIDTVGGACGKACGTASCQHEVRTVGQNPFIHNRSKVTGGKLQSYRLWGARRKLLLQRCKQPVFYIGIELVIGLSGIIDVASRARIKDGAVALKYLCFQLLVNGIEKYVDNGCFAQNALGDPGIIGEKNRIVLHGIDSHGPYLAVHGEDNVLVQPLCINIAAVGYRSCNTSCRRRFCGGCLNGQSGGSGDRSGKKQTYQ